MIANRYVIAIFVIIAVPLLTFLLRTNIAEYANKYLGIFADTTTFNSVVQLTENNRPIFDILKNGQYEFDKNSTLDTVDDKKWAQYFGGEISGFVEREKQLALIPKNKIQISPKTKKANVGKSKPKVDLSKRYNQVFIVTFIYYGDNEKYAIIDGNLVKQGATLARGYVLEEITPDKIKVKTPGGSKWFTIDI